MILIDVNVWVYAYDHASPRHTEAKKYLEEILNSEEIISLPWAIINGFLRTVTNPAVYRQIFEPKLSMEAVLAWIAMENVYVTEPGAAFVSIYQKLMQSNSYTGNDIPDLYLVALAIENNATLVSYDRDFTRFEKEGLKWFNPLAKQKTK